MEQLKNKMILMTHAYKGIHIQREQGKRFSASGSYGRQSNKIVVDFEIFKILYGLHR